jgi:hypothetical protein
MRNVPPYVPHIPCCSTSNVEAGTVTEQRPLLAVGSSQQANRRMVQLASQNSWPSHHSRASMMPLPHVLAWVVVVVLDVVVVDVVAQPDWPQASQQLVYCPTHPPFAVHRSGVVILQRLTPLDLGRQHVTAPDLPQVDRDAHFLPAFRHADES